MPNQPDTQDEGLAVWSGGKVERCYVLGIIMADGRYSHLERCIQPKGHDGECGPFDRDLWGPHAT